MTARSGRFFSSMLCGPASAEALLRGRKGFLPVRNDVDLWFDFRVDMVDQEALAVPGNTKEVGAVCRMEAICSNLEKVLRRTDVQGGLTAIDDVRHNRNRYHRESATRRRNVK